jgi:uncharacterized protein (DUF3084 family)
MPPARLLVVSSPTVGELIRNTSFIEMFDNDFTKVRGFQIAETISTPSVNATTVTVNQVNARVRRRTSSAAFACEYKLMT